MKSVMMARRLTLDTVQVEVFSGLDGQGKPSYATAVEVQARAVRRDEVIAGGDGSEVRTSLTLHLPPSTSPMPGEEDRITHAGETFIGVQQSSPKTFAGDIAYVRLRCRDE